MSRFLAECVRLLVCNDEPVRVGGLGTFYPRYTKPYRISQELEVHFVGEEWCAEHSPNLIMLINRLGFTGREAFSIIESEVSALKRTLQKEKAVTFGVLGRFVLNGRETVEWEPAVIESGEWWGFAPVEYRVFYRRRQAVPARTVPMLVVLAVLCGLLVYQILRFPGGFPALIGAARDYALWLLKGTPPREVIYLSELESLIVEKIKEVKPLPPSTVAIHVSESVVLPVSPPAPPVSPPHTYSYHIVVASVPSHQYARQLAETLRQRGYTGAFVVKHPARPYWRVVVVSFESMEEAMDSLPHFKKFFAKDAWVLRFDTILALK